MKFSLKTYWLFTALLLVNLIVTAQDYLLLNNAHLQPFEKVINNPNANFHTSVKPYDKSEISKLINVDSVFLSKNVFGSMSLSDSIASKKRINFMIAPILTGTFG